MTNLKINITAHPEKTGWDPGSKYQPISFQKYHDGKWQTFNYFKYKGSKLCTFSDIIGADKEAGFENAENNIRNGVSFSIATVGLVATLKESVAVSTIATAAGWVWDGAGALKDLLIDGDSPSSSASNIAGGSTELVTQSITKSSKLGSVSGFAVSLYNTVKDKIFKKEKDDKNDWRNTGLRD